ncbi:hypothetical protein FA95DRAFT_1280331 [Auriscalpium vulgare]|uniref:Uncharacterized protein n=1 Tax=Auriscalpium vulgare TaxID=40419 RepID=A0ACB8R2B3_9AGAM|nr:hypothetical protein FA95DRAFT_1280331 [Auriscalpium vulgare]
MERVQIDAALCLHTAPRPNTADLRETTSQTKYRPNRGDGRLSSASAWLTAVDATDVHSTWPSPRAAPSPPSVYPASAPDARGGLRRSSPWHAIATGWYSGILCVLFICEPCDMLTPCASFTGHLRTTNVMYVASPHDLRNLDLRCRNAPPK